MTSVLPILTLKFGKVTLVFLWITMWKLGISFFEPFKNRHSIHFALQVKVEGKLQKELKQSILLCKSKIVDKPSYKNLQKKIRDKPMGRTTAWQDT